MLYPTAYANMKIFLGAILEENEMIVAILFKGVFRIIEFSMNFWRNVKQSGAKIAGHLFQWTRVNRLRCINGLVQSAMRDFA